MGIRFTLNGREIDAGDVDPHTTVLNFVRSRGLTGSKEGCAEGECGACAVALVRRGADGRTRYEPVNSCLLLVGAVAGQELVTVEGIAKNGELHPVQDAMARLGGSQCGYCTPGFVVSLFAEFYRPDREGYDPEAISGNLCRCTGYRPIRDAARSMGRPSPADPFAARLASPPPAFHALGFGADARRFDRPTSLAELFRVLESAPDAKLVAGGTDVVVEVNQRDARFSHLISIDAVEELHAMSDGEDALEIGAGVPLAHVERRLHGQLPMLDQLLPLFSSRLIRNRATFGGNLVNASPIGDGPPALMALGAELRALSARGERVVPLDRFFTGYRKTVLEPGEIVVAVRIPKPLPRIQRFYKVSKRVMDDISTVAAGFAIDLDDQRRVVRARLAYGGVAATPVRATAAEDALAGAPWTHATLDAVRPLLERAFAPIDDHRGSEAYRRAMITSLFDKLFHETHDAAGGAA